MALLNGSDYRAVIDGEKIKNERKLSLESDEIRVLVLSTKEEDDYNKWNVKKGQRMNFKISNTDFNADVILKRVIKTFEMESAVEIELRFSYGNTEE